MFVLIYVYECTVTVWVPQCVCMYIRTCAVCVCSYVYMYMCRVCMHRYICMCFIETSVVSESLSIVHVRVIFALKTIKRFAHDIVHTYIYIVCMSIMIHSFLFHYILLVRTSVMIVYVLWRRSTYDKGYMYVSCMQLEWKLACVSL